MDFCGTQKLFAVLTRADQKSLFWSKWIQSTLSNFIALRFLPILSLHVSLSLQVPGQSIICNYGLCDPCWTLTALPSLIS